MSIDSQLYRYANKEATAWRLAGSNSANLGVGPSGHAERALFTTRQNELLLKMALFVQNAYPCTGCHNFFLEQSLRGFSIIVKVTADRGSYGAEHGFMLNSSPVPAIFYYRHGQSRIVTMTDRAPLPGFPAVPDFDEL